MVFSLILPDLAPSTSDPAEVATWGTGTGFHKELHILVEYGMNYISQEQQFENAFSQSEAMRRSSEAFDTDHGLNITQHRHFLDRNTFELQSNGCKKYVGESIFSTMLYTCRENSSIILTTCRTNVAFPHVTLCSITQTKHR